MSKDKLDIVYEDKYLIVINKPTHLLTISTDNEKERTLFHKVYTYLKQKNKNNKVFIVHRLDKDTSGLIVFAKSEEVKRKLQNNWDKSIRNYVCVVNGIMEHKKERLISYLKETKTLLVYSVKDKSGDLAITNYEVVMNNNEYSLLSINIETGRKNQIRVQLSDINHSIVGDKKYGIKKDPLRRLCLHANYLKFKHPILNKDLEFDIDIPNNFINLVKER